MKYIKFSFLLVFLLFLSSCQQTIDDDVEFDYILTNISLMEVDVVYTFEITNPHDYNMTDVILVLDAYSGDTFLGEVRIETEAEVKHRRNALISDKTSLDDYLGIDRLVYKTYEHGFASFFQSYIDGFTLALIVAVIMLIPLLVYFVIESYMYSDFINLIKSYYYVIPIPFTFMFVIHVILNVISVNRLAYFYEWTFVFYTLGTQLLIIPLAFLFLFIQDVILNIGKIKV